MCTESKDALTRNSSGMRKTKREADHILRTKLPKKLVLTKRAEPLDVERKQGTTELCIAQSAKAAY